MKYLFQSERLGFRNWVNADISLMAAISSDPEVMRFFPSVSTLEYTEKLIRRMQDHFEKAGYCYFAVDRLDNGEMIGFIGLMYQDFEADFTPCVDIGWRLKKSVWRRGYATEGAKACLNYAFQHLEIPSVYSVASSINTPSIAVMQKIGMRKEYQFQHSKLMHDERIRDCELYRIDKDDFRM